MFKDKLSVIIPVYNEEKSIYNTLNTLYDVLNKTGIRFQIIVVNDGSTDNTAAEINKIVFKIITIHHEMNKGYGAALKTGIKHAASELVLITDADSTYPVEIIPELIGKMESSDMVVGARIGDKVKIPLLRRIPKTIIRKLAEYLSERKIPDLNSGLRIMKKDIVLRFLPLLPNGFSFTTTITLAMITNDYRVNYIPIDYHKREGISKIKPIKDTLNFIQLIIKTILYFEPLKIFIPASLAFFLLSIALVLYRIIMSKGFLVVTVIVFVTAIQLLAIGMLADLIDKRMR
ncbi:MAG: glycosyltransferase family 2 protein [bacterium]|nr:glycosyltransferase family 2 protein [bacterium]MDD5756810.1 glycosyltransferase family 2 protein [bacterium]